MNLAPPPSLYPAASVRRVGIIALRWCTVGYDTNPVDSASKCAIIAHWLTIRNLKGVTLVEAYAEEAREEQNIFRLKGI